MYRLVLQGLLNERIKSWCGQAENERVGLEQT